MRFAPFVETYGDYFRAMGIALLAGRTFTIHDLADTPLVIVVNQSMARQSWPGKNPLGKRMHLGNPNAPLPWATVVGVVADTRIGAPDQPAPDQFYFPLARPAIINGTGSSGDAPTLSSGFVTLRSTLPPDQMIHTLRSVVTGLDPQLALDPVRSMADALSNVEAPRRFNTRLIAVFAVSALLLAVIGIRHGIQRLAAHARNRNPHGAGRAACVNRARELAYFLNRLRGYESEADADQKT